MSWCASSNPGKEQENEESFHRLRGVDHPGLHYDAEADLLVLISDANNAIFYARRTGELIGGHALPSQTQERITVDARGNLYLAQDSGGIIKYEPRK